MIGPLILIYLMIGLVVAGIGVQRGWGPYSALEHHPQFFLIWFTWPLWAIAMFAWQLGTWVIALANPDKFKENK